MVKYFLKSGLILVIVLVHFSCQQTNKVKTPPVFQSNSYASHFSIKQMQDYSILTIKDANKDKNTQYVLEKENAIIPDSLHNAVIIKVPVSNIIVTSTTHLAFLKMLGVGDKLLAFPNTKYVSEPFFRQKIDYGAIQEIGNGIQLNTEKVLSLKPALIMAFSSGQDAQQFDIYRKNNIPVLFNNDWLEPSPLGRTEWIKVFGALFDKQDEANRIFDTIVSNYKRIQQNVINSAHPIVFQGGLFGDKWYVPGGNSYAAQLIKDAGGEYIWNNDSHTGSINVNYENVLVELPKAQIWLNPGMNETLLQIAKEIPQSKNFATLKNHRVYSYNLVKGATGGVLYFEMANAHPDNVLADLFHIFNPENNPDYQFNYYKQLPD